MQATHSEDCGRWWYDDDTAFHVAWNRTIPDVTQALETEK